MVSDHKTETVVEEHCRAKLLVHGSREEEKYQGISLLSSMTHPDTTVASLSNHLGSSHTIQPDTTEVNHHSAVSVEYFQHLAPALHIYVFTVCVLQLMPLYSLIHPS